MVTSRRREFHRLLKATSLVLVIKGAVAGSVTMLALLGVSVPVLGPWLGIEATNFSGGVAATVGAVLGAIAAFRA